MVDEKFIETLITKRENSTPEQIMETFELAKKMWDKKTDEEKFGEAIINNFTDKMHLAEQFYEINPFYYDRAGIWWIWRGSHKPETPTGDNLTITKNSGLSNYYEMWDEVDILNSITFASPADTINSKERSEILQAMKQTGRLHKPKDIKKSWIHFQDVVIDIKTGDKFDATPEYFYTNPIPHNLGTNEETPVMDKIFKEWVGEKYVQTLYEIISYCLLKDYPMERIICLLGSGSNGKSCYLKLLRTFLGADNIVSSDLNLLTSSRFETAKLRSKLACLIGETNLSNIDNTQLIKRLTSGKDPVPIEYKNKGLMDYINFAKLIMATNSLPETKDKTIGWGRRWLIVDFPKFFEKEIDILGDIPLEEYENLGLKSITLLIGLLKERNFNEEGDVKTRIARYEGKSDFLQKFLDDYTTEDINGYIGKTDFRKKFSQWCIETGHRALADNTIGKKLKRKGFESGRVWVDWMNEGKGGNLNAYLGLKWQI